MSETNMENRKSVQKHGDKMENDEDFVDESSSNFDVMEELDEVVVPKGTLELYKLLASCNLLEKFEEFINESFDDEAIALIDPNNLSALDEILKKGAQIKFKAALIKFQASLKTNTPDAKDSGNEDASKDEAKQETQMFYKAFNKFQVSFVCVNVRAKEISV